MFEKIREIISVPESVTTPPIFFSSEDTLSSSATEGKISHLKKILFFTFILGIFWLTSDDLNNREVWSVLPIDETTQPSEKCYDDKHNVLCDEVTVISTDAPKKDIRGMSGTMSLVIGIILGSFIAMILIVIIVLKVRTGVDIAECKQVRKTYFKHFQDEFRILKT